MFLGYILKHPRACATVAGGLGLSSFKTEFGTKIDSVKSGSKDCNAIKGIAVVSKKEIEQKKNYKVITNIIFRNIWREYITN